MIWSVWVKSRHLFRAYGSPVRAIKPSTFDSASSSWPYIKKQVSINGIDSQSSGSPFGFFPSIGIRWNVSIIAVLNINVINIFKCKKKSWPSPIKAGNPYLSIAIRRPVEITYYPINCKPVQCLKNSACGFNYCCRILIKSSLMNQQSQLFLFRKKSITSFPKFQSVDSIINPVNALGFWIKINSN